MSSEESKRIADPHETPNQKRPRTSSCSDEEKKEEPETPQSFSIDTLQLAKDWTPGGHQRSTKKIQTSHDGKLRGGDFVFNEKGHCVTVGVFFEQDSKTYGITAGHFTMDRLYKFEKYDDDDSTKILVSYLGKAINIDIGTDSLIFEVDDDKKEMVDVLRLVPKAGLGDRPVQLGVSPANTAPPERDTEVIIYGAMGRGAFGKVVIPSAEFAGTYSKVGDIGVQPDESNKDGLHNGGSNSITMPGDRGAFYLDSKGNILGMHHVLAAPNAGYAGTDISFAVPWSKIVEAHKILAQYAGSPEAKTETQQRMWPQESSMELKGGYTETLDIAKFDIKIVGPDKSDNGFNEDLQIGYANIKIIP
mmetsp:Transcript_15873/g.39421  ORF Transcript_15873/g.39421 Transcript_15873/m.39421 type:complete len:361 (-) Transcript_15873:283-1365(-)|eukprot:CAMPEP_0113475412 /NCGR_PEP_ID=MMETSP0014_2-20120614/19106_1 /TAXON_ID=2857 /ORGANISM="Nitzschia sp." /LENGTH=360 /DNA_ID=CAMNT_0000368329 /DNA_START=68 /DNA_END=1150 /DNA_ORIENTATION=+ /assembly_acc=CAM_ASM_000159